MTSHLKSLAVGEAPSADPSYYFTFDLTRPVQLMVQPNISHRGALFSMAPLRRSSCKKAGYGLSEFFLGEALAPSVSERFSSRAVRLKEQNYYR